MRDRASEREDRRQENADRQKWSQRGRVRWLCERKHHGPEYELRGHLCALAVGRGDDGRGAAQARQARRRGLRGPGRPDRVPPRAVSATWAGEERVGHRRAEAGWAAGTAAFDAEPLYGHASPHDLHYSSSSSSSLTRQSRRPTTAVRSFASPANVYLPYFLTIAPFARTLMTHWTPNSRCNPFSVTTLYDYNSSLSAKNSDQSL